MSLRLLLLSGVANAMFASVGLLAASVADTNAIIATPPVFVPDMSLSGGPLPSGSLVWSTDIQTTNAPSDLDKARFVFGFTNVSSGNITIVDTKAQCSCTVAELPKKPWIIPPGSNGQIVATVDLTGKNGVMVKNVTILTDHGSKDLYMRITILPVVIPTLTDEERARDVEVARHDRQAIFQPACAICHAKPGEGKNNKALYDAVCANCHEAEHRASFVPDLHNLKVPTSNEFWRTWIAHGKPGSLMPAFSTAEGGSLSDMQIAILAAYLDMVIPSRFPQPPPTNTPPAHVSPAK